jgi:hypothetical protein
MCGGGAPSIPPPPPPPPPPPTPSQPKSATASAKKAESDELRNKAKEFASTRGGTLVTGPSGLLAATSGQKKTLLGA